MLLPRVKRAVQSLDNVSLCQTSILPTADRLPSQFLHLQSYSFHLSSVAFKIEGLGFTFLRLPVGFRAKGSPFFGCLWDVWFRVHLSSVAFASILMHDSSAADDLKMKFFLSCLVRPSASLTSSHDVLRRCFTTRFSTMRGKRGNSLTSSVSVARVSVLTSISLQAVTL